MTTRNPNTRVAIAMGGFTRSMTEFFTAIAGLTKDNAWKKFQAFVLVTFNKIKNRTPVDTGMAKSSWRVEINQVEEGYFTAEIWNGVHYIVYLEFGSSKQAPAGMLRIVLLKQSAVIRNILKGLSRGR